MKNNRGLLVAGGIVAIVVVIGVIAMSMGGKDDSMNNAETSMSGPNDSMQMESNENTNTTAPAASEATESNTVTIADFNYGTPIKVKVGTKVTWTNTDNVAHDVMPDKPSDDFKASELLNKGESYSFTFTKAGEYTYFCTPHPYMKGLVVVTE